MAILAITSCIHYTQDMKKIMFSYREARKITAIASILTAILLISESVFFISAETARSDRPDEQSSYILQANSTPTYTSSGMVASRSRQKLKPAPVLLSSSHGIQSKCEYQSMSANYRLARYSRAHHVVHHQLLI